MIDKSKSFADQIKLLEKVENLHKYYSINGFDDQELKSKIFKLKLSHTLKIIDKKLFEQMFGDTLEALANKLINKQTKKKIKQLFKTLTKIGINFMKWIFLIIIWMIQPSDRRIGLIDAIKLISGFNENENENVNENDEKLMSSDKDDDETMRQNEIKKLNDYFDKMIDKSKSFEDQIKSLEKVENLNKFYSINDFHDKELKSKIFKLKLAHLSNIIDKKLFKTIFCHTLETSASKLINTTNRRKSNNC